MTRGVAVGLALVLLLLLGGAAASAPEFLPDADLSKVYQGFLAVPPFGTDQRGRPLLAYALQGAAVLVWPSLGAGLLVGVAATLGGVLRCLAWPWADRALQLFGEVVGALPRLVVLLVAALLLPPTARTLGPLALVWAVLCAPNAIDEAGAVAERLGGARFVEALRAHGFGAWRIFGLHIAAWNLRPVVVRQAAETTLQVAFLEISLSYLAGAADQPSLTHSDRSHSWADLLIIGYPSLVVDVPTGHALVLGVGLMGLLVALTRAVAVAGRAR